MASIRKRGNSYLLVVSMGYDPEGHRRKPQQKTVHPPKGLTPKAKEKWLEEEAALFERQCKNQPLPVDKSITLAEYTAYWLGHIAPGKLAKSTLARDKQDDVFQTHHRHRDAPWGVLRFEVEGRRFHGEVHSYLPQRGEGHRREHHCERP